MDVQLQTDIGLRREQNEDFVSRFENKDNEQLIVLADGMGGHKAGDIASRFAVTKLGLAFSKTSFQEKNENEIKEWFAKELQVLNTEVVDKGKSSSELAEMGTTVVAVYVKGNKCLIMHVGDSRGYLLRDHSLQLLTEDHTFVNELYKLKMLTKEEAENHKDRHRLTQAIGVPFEIKPDFKWFELVETDFCLLCSDGLTNMVSEEKITEILVNSNDLATKANNLIEAAKKAGGIDNITVAILKSKEVSE